MFQTPHGIMEALEIQNPHYFFNFFIGIDEDTMVLPSILMLTAICKLYIGFIFGFIILLSVTVAGWRVAESHEYE